MKLEFHGSSKSPLPEKTRSLRLKKPCFDKWKDYDLKFYTDPKVRKRKRATLVRDEGQLVEVGRKRSKKVVSLRGFDQNSENSPFNEKLEKPLILDDDLFIPKRPRCISKRKKVGPSSGYSLNNSKMQEVSSFDEGKTANFGRKDLNNGRNLRPRNQCGVSFVKLRRRFYEVFSGDIDPNWVVKQRIQIFWPLDAKWYFGVVKAYNLKSMRHFIKYDDDDEEWVDLRKERFKLLLYPTEIPNRISKLKMKMEDDPIGSGVFCKSAKVSDRSSQTNVSKKKGVSFVYFRRRLRNAKVDNFPKLVLHISVKSSLPCWLLRLPLFSSHGIVVPVWQPVRVEMAVIDNFIGLRIFSFEGHLKGAVDLLCFVISRFCQKKVVRRNKEVDSERKQPSSSIGIKISGLNVQTTGLYLLTYRFHEFGILEWGLIESRMRKRNCFRVKKLSVANCTYANLCKVSSGNDMLFPPLCNGSSERGIGYHCMATHKIDSPVVLIYHKTSCSIHPSLFPRTHLKLLIDKNAPASPASSVLSPHAWNIKTQLNSVSPTSVLSTDGLTPHSKRHRTVVSFSPLAVNHSPNSRNKPHFMKRHSLPHSNTSEIPQIYTQAAPAKTIPTPGTHLIYEPDEICSRVQYVRDSNNYHREVSTEVERALETTHVLYDMDSADEEWFNNYNDSTLSEDKFEWLLDSFEKLAHKKKSDELTAVDLEEITSKLEHRDFIKDVYEYWRHKRQRTGLPLIRQFQPPLWEVYQKQVREWELSTSRLRTSLPHDFSEKACVEQKERPAPFAFCLKPRGLEFLNKGAKPRPHKKFLTSGSSCCSSPRELDAVLYAFGKKSCESVPPHAHNPSDMSSPRDKLRKDSPKELVNTRRHHGIIQCRVEPDMSELKSQDASAAAFHAAKIAKLKREKAQLLLQKADLAVYKAVCARVIADAMETSGKDATS
ncbi:Enhancer of polycomb-like transcription factor protein [Rhynchospora pubera]|uniref:Enhancer of polycomb-like protein n=1 Tax=Rhynchospora pubera TaxID=906938 RepID=A0AAV8HWV7_9POAL|nr:Enhancer of polycomb-like transcription factor protein [Rhynchospora pubera]